MYVCIVERHCWSAVLIATCPLWSVNLNHPPTPACNSLPWFYNFGHAVTCELHIYTYMEHCRKVLLFNSAHAWTWEIRQELTLSLLHLSSLWLLPPSYYSINYMQSRLICTLRKHNTMQLHSYSKLYSNSHIKIIIILCIYVYTNSHINAIH